MSDIYAIFESEIINNNNIIRVFIIYHSLKRLCSKWFTLQGMTNVLSNIDICLIELIALS